MRQASADVLHGADFEAQTAPELGDAEFEQDGSGGQFQCVAFFGKFGQRVVELQQVSEVVAVVEEFDKFGF